MTLSVAKRTQRSKLCQFWKDNRLSFETYHIIGKTEVIIRKHRKF